MLKFEENKQPRKRDKKAKNKNLIAIQASADESSDGGSIDKIVEKE